MKYLFYSLISFILTLLIYKNIFPFLYKFFLDVPNQRSSHSQSKPRAGGIVFIFIATIFCLITGDYSVLIMLPLAIVSLLDDFKHVKAIIRYSLQFLTSFGLLFHNDIFNKINLENNSFGYFLMIILIILSTAIINFVNFMDGIDGIVTLSFFIIFLYASISYPIYFPLSFSLLAFLFLNWEPAKLFMGDCGSTFIGCVFLDILFKSIPQSNSINLLLIVSPFILDPTFTIIKRYFMGKNIFNSHKDHIYQKLVQCGISHKKISIIYSSTVLFLILGSIYINPKYIYTLIIPVIFIGFLLNKYSNKTLLKINN